VKLGAVNGLTDIKLGPKTRCLAIKGWNRKSIKDTASEQRHVYHSRNWGKIPFQRCGKQ
jgi:hypothetical protein